MDSNQLAFEMASSSHIDHQVKKGAPVEVVDIGNRLHERDRKRAGQLYRTQSLGKGELDPPDVLGKKFEPDWSKFESRYAKELLPSSGGSESTCQFLLEVVDILLDYIRRSNDRTNKVLDFHHPGTLKEMMSHCLELGSEPQNLEQVLSDCKETLKYCVKTGHPRFFNQLSTGLDMIALAGEWLTATANTNMFTYEIAPVFTLMEEMVLVKMRELVGWPSGDGIFAPGGAIANLYAVLCARNRAIPNVTSHGIGENCNLIMFTSEQSHFSIKRAGAIVGVGTDNVVLIKSDRQGRMDVDDLETQIARARAAGSTPFFVAATAGTTVLGAFDPIEQIAEVCSRGGIWFHVDGAWGGSALLSRRYRHLLTGVDRADSMTWNPHKLMGSTLQCSAILLRERGILEATNSLRANYLFQRDKHYDLAYDTGDKAIQCGRHNDVFKLWLMWRAKGDSGFEENIHHLMAMSKYLQERIVNKEGFEFVLDEPEFINVCFWYVPRKLRLLEAGQRRNDQLHQVAPKVKAMMMERGGAMVGYQPLGERPNFFRMIVSNPAAQRGDIDFLLDEIESLGEKIDEYVGK